MEKDILPIKVTPKAAKNEIVGWENDELKIRIAAIPDKGQANKELVRFLSKALKISKSDIIMVSGETSRQKKLLIRGKTLEELNL